MGINTAHSVANFVENLLLNRIMDQSLILSSRVIKSLRTLPVEDRNAITTAIISEFIGKENPEGCLTPFQSMLYSMIRWYVEHDNFYLHKVSEPTVGT